jgi:hypothetical protein
MSFKNKIYPIISVLVGQLFLFGSVAIEPLEAGDPISRLQIVTSDSGPEQYKLNLISFSPLHLDSEIIGSLAVYDDPATERPADYLELYNSAGDLLVVGWFDRFGIQRMAVDRGLLQGAHKLEGVFVLVLGGDSI